MNDMRLFTPAVCLLALMTSAAALADETIYKYRLQDGSVLYTQEKRTGAKLLDVIRSSSPSPEQLARAERELERDRALASQLSAQRYMQGTAERRIRLAAQALDVAEAALRDGLEPLPGERRVHANGGSQLTDAYWERQRALQQAVEIARQRLDAATSEYQATRLTGTPTLESSGR